MKIGRITLVAAMAVALPALAADIGITQKDQTFSQSSITIAAGGTVLWGNADDYAHNITIKGPDGVVVDTGEQKHGVVIKHTFDKPGAYRIICGIHPKMKMTVIVQ